MLNIEQEKSFLPEPEGGEKPLSTPYQETFELTESISEKIKRGELKEEEARQFCNDVFFKNFKDIQKLDFFEQLPLLIKLSSLEGLFFGSSPDFYEPPGIGRQEAGGKSQKMGEGGRKEVERLLGLVSYNAEAALSNGIIFDIHRNNRSIEDLNPEKAEILLDAIGVTFIRGNIHQSLAIKDFLEKYEAQFQKLGQKSERVATGHEAIKDFFSSAFAETHLASRIQDKMWENRNFLFRKEGREAMEWLGMILQKYSLPIQEMLKSWFSHLESAPKIGSNVSRISEIEEKNPGIAKFLYQKFGIRNFERYPKEVLSAMLKEYDDSEKPYGIIINPTNDWNGAFSQDSWKWQKLFDQLQEGGYVLRIMEARGKVELAKHLVRLDRQYGSRQKISFGIIGGHGTGDSINFGGDERVNKLYISDLAGVGAKKVSRFFGEGFVLILGSCSGGVEGGIGQETSRVANAEIIAPNGESHIKSIEVKRGEYGLDFEVEFVDEKGKTVETKVFKGGEEVK